MRAHMMDVQLTIAAIARRAEALAPRRAVVAMTADGVPVRSTWAETIERSRRLAVGLRSIGVRPGDRVGTLCWNSREHLEAYLGVPASGAVLHTLNTRLDPEDLAFMLRDAGTEVLIADATMLEAAVRVAELAGIDRMVVTGTGADGHLGYEELLAGADPGAFTEPEIDERDACTICYTTGTTGRPKGVVYSHRALAIQSLVLMAADLNGIRERDVVLVVVPMFHANGWGHPYAAALAGASLVLPHRDLSPAALLRLIADERVTHTGGVPTVWEPVLHMLDAAPGRHDTSSLSILRFGGARVPLETMQGFEERHGIPVVHGFGMTELSPMGGMATLTSELIDAPADVRWRQRAKQGRPIPFMEMRARMDDGALAPWDGASPGELELRGPSVVEHYLGGAGAEAFTPDGWLRTGDVVTIDRQGFIDIVDRAKDLIKSGGEWISSVALEQALCGHPGVADAAVVAVPDARWQERPLAVVVRRGPDPVDADELREHLREHVPRWWLPERFQFVDAIPRTAVGKIRKSVLRERYASDPDAGRDRSAGDR